MTALAQFAEQHGESFGMEVEYSRNRRRWLRFVSSDSTEEQIPGVL